MASRPGGPPGRTGLRLEPRQIVEVRSSLRHPALVARLVLDAHQHMRAALALGAAVDVVPAMTDRVLDVTTIGLARLEAPGLLFGTLQEAAQGQAVLATAAHAGLALPVGGRCQVQ